MNITGSDKINVNNNSSNHTSRVVPIDLLPVNEKHLTEDRLKKQLSINTYLTIVITVTMREVSMKLMSGKLFVWI